MLTDQSKPSDSILSTIGSFSGVASLVLAVAGNNLDKLTSLQRWGLAVASAVMLWAFFAGLLFQQFHALFNRYQYGKAGLALVVGGIVGAGLLVAIFPFFSFGLPEQMRDTVSLWLGGSFGGTFLVMACVYAVGRALE